MEKPEMNQQEALELIARVFEQNHRRMNFVRGELFIFWGTLFTLAALAEFALLRWTGDVRVLWSWLVPMVCGYIYTARNARRKALVRTGFDNLLIMIWGFPAMLAACIVIYVAFVPDNTLNPVGVIILLLAIPLAITAEFFRGKGSNQSGSFAALYMLVMAGVTTAFNVCFRIDFDIAQGWWLLALAPWGFLLIVLPGFILRHITRKQCSKS